MDEYGAKCNHIVNGNKYLGYGISNNQAEYQGLIEGLEYLHGYGYSCNKLYIRGDSEIVINQMEGTYNVNSPNIRPYYNTAQKTLDSINVDWTYFRHVSRSSNWEADSLANQAIDG
ncbi:hypothetical protein ACHAWU_008263 [Discostella pseudostelligera]|uniref:RNase H type-1 domain-containing protein n=1 Tax=Discostella pseudostelligera TaxID=259834 RepID=A0ABD3M3D4_9STRA